MSRFTDIVKSDTPRLVVALEGESFRWGVVGNIPLLSLMGAVVRAQVKLDTGFVTNEPEMTPPALVIAWDDVEREFRWFVHPDVPIEPLCAMLELIKATLGAQLFQANRQSQIQVPEKQFLGPNGLPLRN